MYNHTLVIYIQYKFHEIPSIGYKVKAEDEKKSMKFRQSKGNNSSITDDTLVKHWTEGQTDGQHQTYIPPHWAGDKNY